MLTAWHAGERAYAIQAAAADQLCSEQYLDAVHAQACLYRHEQWGMDGDTRAGRDLTKDAHDDSAMHASACDSQLRFVERNVHPAADPITPFQEIGHYSAAMIAAHTKTCRPSTTSTAPSAVAFASSSLTSSTACSGPPPTGSPALTMTS